MTHTPEASFDDAVAAYFEAQSEVKSVETQSYQPEPYWFADIRVEYPWTTLFIEVENDWAAVRKGIGQAIGYAGIPSEPSATPMVVVPAEHVDPVEVERLRGRGVIIQGFDAGKGVFADV